MLHIECPIARQSSITIFLIHPVYSYCAWLISFGLLRLISKRTSAVWNGTNLKQDADITALMQLLSPSCLSIMQLNALVVRLQRVKKTCIKLVDKKSWQSTCIKPFAKQQLVADGASDANASRCWLEDCKVHSHKRTGYSNSGALMPGSKFTRSAK